MLRGTPHFPARLAICAGKVGMYTGGAGGQSIRRKTLYTMLSFAFPAWQISPVRHIVMASLTLLTIAAADSTLAVDFVTVEKNGSKTELAGRIEVEAQDGGVLLLTRDGVLWPIPKEEIAARRKDDKPFTPFTKDELAKKLTSDLPGFKIHQTKHYVFCYNTSTGYAQWVGGLYERLYGAFYNYWKNRNFELHEPEFPLIGLVFENQESYAQYSRKELGEATKSIIGYYSLQSNQVNMYDLTGVEELRIKGDRNSAARINAILLKPGAERTVATIIHEATHQLAYNSGLEARFADNPFWVSEGIAIYFETPDLQSSKGWKNIGGVNHVNLFNFRKLLRDRPAESLTTLLSDDKRFRDPTTASNAYAEAWALNYFLLRTYKDKYIEYIKELARQPQLVDEGPEFRLTMFKKHFGEDLGALDTEFLRYMRSVQ